MSGFLGRVPSGRGIVRGAPARRYPAATPFPWSGWPRTSSLNETSLAAFHSLRFLRAGHPRAKWLCWMEDTGLSLMCASTGVLTWSRTSRSAGLPRKKMPRMRSFFSRPGGFGEKRACNESLEISASPFTTRPARCCGVCATLWEPGHSTIRTLEKSLRSATLPFWLMAMRLCVAMSIAAIVSRHPELDWQRAKRHAAGWCAAHALSGTATIRECVGNSCANSTGSRRREGRSGSQPVSPSCSMVAASWLCAARFVAARRIPHEHAWGRTRWCRLSAAPVAPAHRPGLGEKCAGWPLVALGRPPAAYD